MTKLEQAAQNLLDYFDIDDCGILFNSRMEALREALAEQAEPSQLADASLEPVAWLNESEGVDMYAFSWRKKDGFDTPLYAAPVRTKDLTDDEICRMWNDWHDVVGAGEFALIAHAIIAKYKEKNK